MTEAGIATAKGIPRYTFYLRLETASRLSRRLSVLCTRYTTRYTARGTKLNP